MKTEEKLHHHSPPLRKSPRFSSAAASSSSQLPIKTKPKTRPEANADDAWALSLHVAEPQPLKICHPSQEDETSPRRSPRFTSNYFRTPLLKCSSSSGRRKPKALAALLSSQLRRSPRFSTPPPLTLRSGKVVSPRELGSRKRHRSEETGWVSKKGKTGSESLRLKWGENRNSSSEILALLEQDSGILRKAGLSEKRLRSRTVLMHVEKIDSKKNGGNLTGSHGNRLRSGIRKSGLLESPELSEKSAARSASSKLLPVQRSDFSERCLRSRVKNWALVESPEALVQLPSVQKSDFSEKSLRSRTVKMHVGDKKQEQKSASKSSGGEKCLKSPEVIEFPLIEWPKASDKGYFGISLGRSPRLQEEAGESSKLETINDKHSVKRSPVLEEKCLRSRPVKMQVEKQKSASVKSKSDNEGLRSPKPSLASDDISEIEKELEKSDSERTSEKSLRSRKIPFKVIVDGSPERSASKDEDSAKKDVKSEKIEKKRELAQCSFVGEPIPEEEAREKWGWRYKLKNKRKGRSWKINEGEEDEIILNVDCHYAQAKVGTFVLNIGDCAYIKGEGKNKHIGKILEFFRTTEGEDYFRVQWFYRAEDTVLKDAASSHDPRRVFYSTLTNDNMLDCIISKVKIVKIPPSLCPKPNTIKSAAFYYDMEYCVEYSTFRTLNITENFTDSRDLFSTDLKISDEIITPTTLEALPNCESLKPELALLDLYSGCGGMSTGLCIGAKISNVNLVTKWAVDCNSSACDSLKLNHPETQVRNEAADDFLELLKKWEELYKLHMSSLERTFKCELEEFCEAEDFVTEMDTEASSGEFEVGNLVDICYGDPNETGKRQLHFKVRWKGYGPDEDTWEPIEGLSNCEERIQDFVRKGFKSKILPLPGDVDVICGGPPCQGISGYNRYRNFDSPLDDERNHQIVVFMDIVEFLKPKYVLMENVVDIIRFDKASLARYALSRLVRTKYQARLGTIASGCYGLPQFRLRVFIWGAGPTEKLPQFPLPTHDVVVRYWPPLEFERNIVAYDEGQPRNLEEAIILRDSISDLPPVANDENREQMSYEKPPETEFQCYIRSSRDEIMGLHKKSKSKSKSNEHSDLPPVANDESREHIPYKKPPETEFQSFIRSSRDEIMGHGEKSKSKSHSEPVLHDHRPLPLNENDYLRVCQIPHRKGANFRDLPGVVVGEDNVARLDPMKESVMLPSGRPLVPDCVLSFDQGKSRRPYARVWWDETVSTVLTYPHVRAQAILHPEQDRVLTIRECARLQGFPDFYRFCGTIKERYCQVGNAVSVPVGRALGYALGMAYQKLTGDEPLMTLPDKFASLRHPADEMVVSES